MSRPRPWCWSGTVTSRSRTAACRITSAARSRTGAACRCRRRRGPRDLRLSHTPGEQPRRAGVPFTLCSGKALAADSAEIALYFGLLPGTCPTSGPASNRTSSEWPDRARHAAVHHAQRPGRTAEIRQLGARSTLPRFTACAHLIRDMLNSNPMLFIRGRSRRSMAHHRPRDDRMDSRRRPHAAIPSRPRGPCGRGSGRDDPRDRQGKRGSKRGKVMM
jgi:hypothetical protein